MIDRQNVTATSKVMDVTHPSQVQPPTTSRPVIVTNRSMILEDPMINRAAQSAIDHKKSVDAPKEAAALDETNLSDGSIHQGKTIMPTAESDQTIEPVAETVVDVPAASTPIVTIDSDISPTLDTIGQERAEVPTDSQLGDDKLERKEKNVAKADELTSKTDKLASSSQSLSESKSSTESLVSTELDIESHESEENTAEDTRREEIEAIIAGGTYHVPIGRVSKRRYRIVLTITITILVAIVLFDLALDFGFLSLPGIPHTTFL